MDKKDLDDYMMYKMATSESKNSDGGGGGCGCGSLGIGSIILIAAIIYGLISVVSSCNKRNESASSYKQPSSYTYYLSSQATTKETKKTYGKASPPVKGEYMSDALKEQSHWLSLDGHKCEEVTDKYSYTTKEFSYTFWVNKYGKILVVSKSPRGKAGGTTSGSKKKKTDKEPEFDVNDFAHPEDFYDWYRDDFVDFEEAEDYWEEYHED